MQKDAKREKKLAERKAKRAQRQGKTDIKKDENKALDTSKPLSLDFLTRPDNK